MVQLFNLEAKWNKEVIHLPNYNLENVTVMSFISDMSHRFGLSSCKLTGMVKKPKKNIQSDDVVLVTDMYHIKQPLQKIGIVGSRQVLNQEDEVRKLQKQQDALEEEDNYQELLEQQKIEILQKIGRENQSGDYRSSFRAFGRTLETSSTLRAAQQMAFAGDDANLRRLWQPDLFDHIKSIVKHAILGNKANIIHFMCEHNKFRHVQYFQDWVALSAEYGMAECFVALMKAWTLTETKLQQAIEHCEDISGKVDCANDKKRHHSSSDEKLDHYDGDDLKSLYIHFMKFKDVVKPAFDFTMMHVKRFLIFRTALCHGHLRVSKLVFDALSFDFESVSHSRWQSLIYDLCTHGLIKCLKWLLTKFVELSKSLDGVQLLEDLASESEYGQKSHSKVVAVLFEQSIVSVASNNFYTAFMRYVKSADIESARLIYEKNKTNNAFMDMVIKPKDVELFCSDLCKYVYESFYFVMDLYQSLETTFRDNLGDGEDESGEKNRCQFWNFIPLSLRNTTFLRIVKKETTAQETCKLLYLLRLHFVDIDDRCQFGEITACLSASKDFSYSERHLLLRTLRERYEQEHVTASLARFAVVDERVDIGEEGNRIVLQYLLDSNGRNENKYHQTFSRFATFVNDMSTK